MSQRSHKNRKCSIYNFIKRLIIKQVMTFYNCLELRELLRTVPEWKHSREGENSEDSAAPPSPRAHPPSLRTRVGATQGQPGQHSLTPSSHAGPALRLPPSLPSAPPAGQHPHLYFLLPMISIHPGHLPRMSVLLKPPSLTNGPGLPSQYCGNLL